MYVSLPINIDSQLATAPTNGSVVLWDVTKRQKSKLGENVTMWHNYISKGNVRHIFSSTEQAFKLAWPIQFRPRMTLRQASVN